MKVLLFAAAREAVGAPEIEVETKTPLRLSDLHLEVCRLHPRLARLPLLFAVNEDMTPGDALLDGSETVAFLPPVSGG